jgi:hypothetical protein
MNNSIIGMKRYFLILTAFIVIAAFCAGCTSQPAQSATATSAPSAQVSGTTAAAGPSLTGTKWNLGWYDDTKGVWSSVIQDSTVTATFSSDGTISGWNGCGDYTTEYQLQKTTPGGIWIRRPAVADTTHCQKPTGVDNQVASYYADLMYSEKYTITNNQLQMFDKTGKKILQFDPAA